MALLKIAGIRQFAGAIGFDHPAGRFEE